VRFWSLNLLSILRGYWQSNEKLRSLGASLSPYTHGADRQPLPELAGRHFRKISESIGDQQARVSELSFLLGA